MSMWVSPIDLQVLNCAMQNTVIEYLGIVFTKVESASLTATMRVTEKILQPMGIMHGGASCILAETLGSVAANYCVDQKVKACVGLDININHVRPVTSGTVTAVATPFHLGKTTHVWGIEIRNEEGKIVAIARLTVAVIDAKRG